MLWTEEKTKRFKPKGYSLQVERNIKNLFWNHPEIVDKHSKEIIISQLDIKLRQFTKEVLHVILKNLKAKC